MDLVVQNHMVQEAVKAMGLEVVRVTVLVEAKATALAEETHTALAEVRIHQIHGEWQTNITKHWREIFDPAAQIFLNSSVKCLGKWGQATFLYSKELLLHHENTNPHPLAYVKILNFARMSVRA
ncbi:MAG: hypothetical protein AB7E49_10515 [Campylobacterales bacterium]